MNCLKDETGQLAGRVAVLLHSLKHPAFGRLLMCDKGKSKSMKYD